MDRTHHPDGPGIDTIDLAALVTGHARLAALCARLEGVADRLPLLPTPAVADALRADLALLLAAHDADGRAFARRLFAAPANGSAAPAIRRQIESRRAACVMQGQDIATALLPGAMPATPNTLGYMLRCFFEACRQAMAFEQLATLHLAGGRLTHRARALLIASLVERCAD